MSTSNPAEPTTENGNPIIHTLGGKQFAKTPRKELIEHISDLVARTNQQADDLRVWHGREAQLLWMLEAANTKARRAGRTVLVGIGFYVASLLILNFGAIL